MAGSLHRGTGADDEMVESHEINVTPFIDVMLVLLIVFMIAAPLATVDVPVDLPGSNAERQERPPETLYLTVRDDLSLALGEAAVAREALGRAVDARTDGDTGQRIFLRADEMVAYGDLMEVMNLLRSAGYLKVALVGLESTEAAGGQP
jgi:biopolymer transport protein ExbD